MVGEQKQNDLLHSYGFLKYIPEYQEILTLFLSVPGNNKLKCSWHKCYAY